MDQQIPDELIEDERYEIPVEDSQLQESIANLEQAQQLSNSLEDSQFQFSQKVFKTKDLQIITKEVLSKHFKLLISLHYQINEFYTTGQDDQVVFNKMNILARLIILGQMQVQQLLEIFEQKNNVEKIFQVNQNYYFLGKYKILATSNEQINQTMLVQVIDFELENILNPLSDLINTINQNSSEKLKTDLIRQLNILVSKVSTLREIFPYAVATLPDDVFCYPQTHEIWGKLKNVVTYRELDTIENLKKSYEKIVQTLLLANAMVSKGQEYKNQFVKQAVQGFGAMYYMIAQQKAQLRARAFIADATKSTAFTVWNMGESGMLKNLMPLMFEKISYVEKIYIPRIFPQITLDYILLQYDSNSINQFTPMLFDHIHSSFLPTPAELIGKPEAIKQGRVKVRVLCDEFLETQDGKNNYATNNREHLKLQQKIENNLLLKLMGQGKPTKIFEKIIIHIHGGGFVSMSSRTHQTYTRKWAKQLHVPIFSIDYRKAPEHPYPAGLDDCWQAYLWILNFIEFYLHIVPKKVVLVGDSAGGNLVGALTLLAIKTGVRVPDGILMAYPALNLKYQFFTPSLLISLDDAQSYIQNQKLDPITDPLLSPSVATDELIKRMPRTRIVTGTNDPLHDETWRLTKKMIENEKDIQMVVYPGMPHGFLSFDSPQAMKECAVTVRDACDILRILLDSSSYQEQMENYDKGVKEEVLKFSMDFEKLQI